MLKHCIEQDQRAVENFTAGHGGLIPLTRWGEEIGRTTCTLWRWRNLGWITTLNVAGKLYISRQEIERFEARAQAGEFSRTPTVPRRGQSGGDA